MAALDNMLPMPMRMVRTLGKMRVHLSLSDYVPVSAALLAIPRYALSATGSLGCCVVTTVLHRAAGAYCVAAYPTGRVAKVSAAFNVFVG
jgi:hypothetical protein